MVMKKILALIFLSISLFANDIIIVKSDYSVDQTIENIKTIVKAKGFGVFATINHQGNAKMVGMNLNESKVIIFGNPKVGTLLMQEDMTIALDLPLRVLVYKDDEGDVNVKSPFYREQLDDVKSKRENIEVAYVKNTDELRLWSYDKPMYEENMNRRSIAQLAS